MLTVPLELPRFEPGWVWLVGAGPGDPGLLSLHGLNGLQQADAVVYDALVDQRILDLARPGAELIYAGKRGGKPSPKQADISRKLVELAQAKKRVLRLKGERADKKQAHWQAMAEAGCEQCGANRVPSVWPVAELDAWLARPAPPAPALRCVLSLAAGTQPLAEVLRTVAADTPVTFLSGPEGGLSEAEDARARAMGWVPVTLGARVLRAETAALAALVLAQA